MAVLHAKARQRSATVTQKTNGGTRYRFPMPDKVHARSALARLPQAKNLTAAERAKIRTRARKILEE
tara:strand:- start:31 stop:231 length:201 start_codon:yes stop_codon:yes gene_type:complete